MVKIIPLLTKYWYVAVILVLMVVVYFKKKKVSPTTEDKDLQADEILNEARVRDASAKMHFKTVALQLAQNIGTAYSIWDPRAWSENDDKIYELMLPLNQSDFDIVSSLYFKTYAKGNNLSEDLAKHLDSKLYALLKIK